MCINEIVEFQRWPQSESEKFVICVASQVVSLTNAFSSQIPVGGIDDDENGLAVQMCNLLSVFSKKHIRRCTKLGFDVNNFMTATANVTFKIGTLEGLIHMLNVWSEVAEFVDIAYEAVGKGKKQLRPPLRALSSSFLSSF